jgi:hypothetical protein
LSSITASKADYSGFQIGKYAGEMWQKYGNFNGSQQSGTLLSYSRKKFNGNDYRDS